VRESLYGVRDWREKLALSPASVMLLTLLFIVLTQASAVYLLLNQPWTGLQIEPDPASGFVRVISVDPGSPAEGKIPPDTILTHIQLAGESIPLTSKHFLFPFMHKSRAEFQGYLQQQATIHAFLSSGQPVTFRDISGNDAVVLPHAATSIKTIPTYFWVFLLVFSIVPLMGAFVWSYQARLNVSLYFFIASIACYGFNFVGVINFAKEFFFSFEMAEWLFVLELIGLNVYMPFVFNIMSSYPHRLLGLVGYIVFFIVFVFYSLNFYFAWFGGSLNYLLIQSVLPLLLTLLASQFQIVKSRQNPVDRTAVRVMQLSMIAPFLPIIILHIIPVALGQEPIISKNFVQLLGITSFVGLAIGILRFRLFEVEYWWFKSWLWLLGGCVVVLVDMLLIGLLNTPQLYALGLSVMLTGFLYFPLRQWLLGKLMPLENQSLQDFLPRFSAALAQADSPQAFEKSWQAILQARFTPQHLALQTATLTQPTLADNGLSLRVPALSDGTVYQLSGKHLAARLFNHADIKVAAALLDIARMARNASDAREQAVLEERECLLHDLQATVGAKLRALEDDLPAAHDRQATEEALQALDSTVKLSLQADPFSLHGHLHAWHTEIAQRTAAAGVQLDWQVENGLEAAELSPKQALELTQFLREAVSNALKHAHPACVAIRFARDAERLQVSIGNDGDIKPPESWQAGTGLGGMKARIRALRGDLQVRHLVQQGYVRLDADLPI
jgi:signal transduction histidine kinase